MDHPNWGLITSGATFEALVTTLVFFEDEDAVLFGRRGRDGGQDVRSGDGLRVFQAKHHVDRSAAKAIADAKDEAAKIAKYRDPMHPRVAQWRGVKYWRLVTNAAFNPSDRVRWEKEVAPLFHAQGFEEADCWEAADIEVRLTKFPEVRRAFFSGEPRAFLTLPEIRERLPSEDPFLRRDELPPIVGREGELRQLRDLLAADKLLVVVHGPGGIGKSRLLVAAGEEMADTAEWQVLWANVATLAAGTSWFDSVVPERPTILLVDEPEDHRVLQLLTEQLGGRTGRASRWKVIVTVRSPKDPVLSFLAGPKLAARVAWQPLVPLAAEDARAMCEGLLASGPLAKEDSAWRRRVADELSTRFQRHPIWITLAVHVLETERDLRRVPTSAAALADEYIDEIVRQQSAYAPDLISGILRYIALIGTVNRESEPALRVIAAGTGTNDQTDLLGVIASLVQRRALSQRGANKRLVELKPDVVRDRVLLKWLAVDVGFGSQPMRPSPAAGELLRSISDAIEKGGLSAVGRSILVSIGRTELLLRLSDSPVPLLAPFYEWVDRAATTLRATSRVALAEALVSIAGFRVVDTVRAIRLLRTTQVETDEVSTALGMHTLGMDDVVLSLAWPTYHAAIGAQTLDERVLVLAELLELVEAESDIGARLPGGLPNDGRRAAAMIGRVIEGAPYFWSTFDDAAGAVAVRLMDALGRGAPSSRQLAASRAIVRPLVAVERHQTWVEGNSFILRKYVITEDHPGWQARHDVLSKIKAMLEDNDVPLDVHVVLWTFLAEAHRLANYVALHGPREFKTRMHAEFVAELEWTLRIMERRGARFEEVKAARQLWEWHAKYDDDAELKALSNRLEEVYKADALAAEFDPLVRWEAMDELEQRSAAAADRLRGAGADAIGSYIERGVRFLGVERQGSLLGVATMLGRRADDDSGVRDFVRRALGSGRDGFDLEFAIEVSSQWVFVVRRRRQGGEAAALVHGLHDACGSDMTRMRLLSRLYGVARFDHDDVDAQEHAFLRASRALFQANRKLPAFVAMIGWTVRHEWEEYTRLVEESLDELDEPALSDAVTALIEAVFWAVSDRAPSLFPGSLAPWLLQQVMRVSDVDRLGDMAEWRLERIVDAFGRLPVSWLPPVLAQRATLEHERGYSRVRALGFEQTMTRYIRTIDEAQADDSGAIGAVDAILDLEGDTGTVGYRLPDVLHEVDPHGVLVPQRVAVRIDTADVEALKRLSRLARAYVTNTNGWRTIAASVLRRVERLEPQTDKRGFFASLADPGVRSWTGTPGEVPQAFVTAVEIARRYRDEEGEDLFRPLWEWYLSEAEADLRHEEERAKEDRGE